MRIKEFLNNLWHILPSRWRVSFVWGALSFIFGTVVTFACGSRVLLQIYLLVFAAALLLSWLRVANLAMQQFWTHIRGMTISTILPASFASFQKMLTDFSSANVIDFVASLAIILIIWSWFDKIIKKFMLGRNKL